IVLGTKTALAVGAEHEVQKCCQDPVEVAHFDLTVDGESLVLEEHVVIGGVDGFVAIGFPWSDDPDWWLPPLHHAGLHCGCVTPQQYVWLQQVDGILHLSCRMVWRNI